MRTVAGIHDAQVRNYEINDRVQRFHDTGGDNDRARPLPDTRVQNEIRFALSKLENN